MIWTLYAISHSVFRAIFAEINRIYRVDAWQLTFLHALCAMMLLLPFTRIMAWPADSSFYLAAAMVALISTVAIVIQLNLASEQNGRTSVIAIPFEALGAFLIWLAVDPDAWAFYAGKPLALVSLGMAFAIAVFGLLMLRGHDVNRRTIMVMAPVALTCAVAGVVTKVVIPTGESLIPALLSFVMVNYIVMTITMGVVLLVKRRATAVMHSSRALQAGFMTGMLSLMGYATFVAAVVMAPNPGYVSMTGVLVPVWLFMYHHAQHREDHSSAVAALLIITSVLVLVIASQL